jgi:hypothetical protein
MPHLPHLSPIRSASTSAIGLSKSKKKRSKELAKLDSDGFCNYSPSDGKDLLTGVAPSGSSKESVERRRRMRYRPCDRAATA